MINGLVYNNRSMPAAAMAHGLRKAVGGEHITRGCTMSYSGRNITISAGYFMPEYGEMVSMEGSTTVDAGAVSSQYYCILVYEIDLSKTNTTSNFQQGTFKVIKGTTGYPTPTQNDLEQNTSGKYQMVWAKFIQNSGGISNFSDERPPELFTLRGTLSSGSASLTLSDSRIRTCNHFDFYTSIYGLSPKNVSVQNGSITMTFNAQSGPVDVEVRCS